MKYINFKRLNFDIITKYVNNLRHSFSKTFKYVDFDGLRFNKIYKYLNFLKFDYKKIIKNQKLKSFKFLPLYFLGFLFFITFAYLIIPYFYSLEKSRIEQIICKNKKIECLINGKIKYNFYPTPRINLYDITIKSNFEKNKTIASIEKGSMKLSFFDLLDKKKKVIKEIEFRNYEINFDLNHIKKYQNIFNKNTDFIPVIFVEGKILFFDGKNYVSTINESFFKFDYKKDFLKIITKGKFLGDNIYLDIDTKIKKEKTSSDLILKISKLDLILKANFYYLENKRDNIKGNFLIRQNKNKITSLFSYSDNTLNIIKANVANRFAEGNSQGKISFTPYFNFDIDLDLNSLNFTKLYNYFLSLSENDKRNFFKINQKINGSLALSSRKIYSGYNLAKSFEARLKFNNGNIFIEQFLINLGKLGAADLLGKIEKRDKTNNFKFESNIYVDNEKKFLSKFGIYNKDNIPSNMFVSGNFDINKPKLHFYEVFYKNKLRDDDVNYIEKAFNNIMFEDNYNTLFFFPNFKEFIKSISAD